MSLSIMIGSEAEDYVNVKNTIIFLESLTELQPLGLMDEDRNQVLDDLIDWYKSMYDVLTNPALGSEELYDPSELTK